MKLIAHRGLTNGPNASLENKPEQILKSIKEGYDCEIDLWFVNSELYLGHDGPTYLINRDFLDEPGLWVHAKNLAAFRFLVDTHCNFFWHNNDDHTLTSHKFIWTYPGKELTMRSVMVMPEWIDETLDNARSALCYGVCSDFVALLK